MKSLRSLLCRLFRHRDRFVVGEVFDFYAEGYQCKRCKRITNGLIENGPVILTHKRVMEHVRWFH